MQHHRMNKYSCGEQALAVDVLRSAVQEIKDRLHHVRSATTLAAKHDHLLAIVDEAPHHVTADIAAPACNQYAHRSSRRSARLPRPTLDGKC